MPLTTVNMVPGGWLKSVDIKQYADLLLGTMTDQPVALGNTLSVGGSITQLKIGTPAPPPAGYMKLYPKADNKYYKLDSAGVETELGTGGGGGTQAADTEEFLPAAAATTVTLSRTPDDVLLVTRDGMSQSTTAGNYSVAGAVLTFTDAFDGSERVLVTFVVGVVGAVGIQGPTGPTGATGSTGAQGVPGQGVPTGGSTGQVLTKNSATNYDTIWLPGGTDITPWSVVGGPLTVTPDNTYDIGASTATRPRSLYLGNHIQQAAIVTPANPPAGSMRIYPKSDGEYYKLNSAGQETVLGAGAQAADTEEFLPANGTTTITLSRSPQDVWLVTRNGLAQTTAAGDWTVLGNVITFTDAFSGSERVTVHYAFGVVGATGPIGPSSSVHEEFMPANGATTVLLSQVPQAILMCSRAGVVQSAADGNYSLAVSTLTFTDAFNGSERVIVDYASTSYTPTPPINGSGISAGTLPGTALADGAVTAAKLARLPYIDMIDGPDPGPGAPNGSYLYSSSANGAIYRHRTGNATSRLIDDIAQGVVTTAMIAANALTQVFAAPVASGFQTTVNNWVETNVTGTWTFTGVQCRIDQTFIFYHSAAAAGIYVGWMLDGVVQAATGYLNMPVANQTQTVHSAWFATIPAGSHRVSLAVYSATAGTLTFNAAAYSLIAVTEFRR